MHIYNYIIIDIYTYIDSFINTHVQIYVYTIIKQIEICIFNALKQNCVLNPNSI